MKIFKYSFEVKDNWSFINIDIYVLGVIIEYLLFVVYLRKGEEFIMDGDDRDKVCVIFLLFYKNNDSSWKNFSINVIDVLFFSNKEFNGIVVGEYFVIIEYNGIVSGVEVFKESMIVEYLFFVYIFECLYWNEWSEVWVEDGCVVRYFF